MDANKARKAHKIMDALFNGKMVLDEEREFLRSFLPELPTQKTLEEIAWDIDFARAETFCNDWKEEIFGDLETWLTEQHTQLRAHLEGVKGEARPKVLETEADYANAPEGTIVTKDDCLPWAKEDIDDWTRNGGSHSDHGMARSGRRYILRWGWGE